MKHSYLYLLIAFIAVVSCTEKKEVSNTFSGAKIENSGRFWMGLVYNQTIALTMSDGTTVTIPCWSRELPIANGTYHLTPGSGDAYEGYDMHFSTAAMWGEQAITGGTITVEHRGGNKYTITLSCLLGETQRNGSYSGDVNIVYSPSYDPEVGIFTIGQYTDLNNLVDVSGPINPPFRTRISLIAGNENDYSVYVSLAVAHDVEDNIAGTYLLNSLENDSLAQHYIFLGYIRNQTVEWSGFQSGTFTITPVDKAWPYRIDIDGVDLNGNVIRESYNGPHWAPEGSIWYPPI